MKWPEQPTCHGGETVLVWREPVVIPGDRVTPFRSCSYCGSIHPEDLVNAFKDREPHTTIESNLASLNKDSPTLVEDHRAMVIAAAKANRVPKMWGADWKYGWPHKFYVDFPVPEELRDVKHCSGSRSWTDADGVHRHERYTDPVGLIAHGKWYNEHLTDRGYDEEAWTVLTEVLLKHTDIKFFKKNDDDRVRYTAPHRGYQRV